MAESFLSPSTGWALAQAARCPHRICPAVVLHTTDGGRSWRRLPTPHDVALRGAQRGGSVDAINFINRRVGWLYGGDLWSTRDGGRHWTQDRGIAGTVESLAVSASRVYAVGASCDTAGQNCQYGRLYQAPLADPVFHRSAGLPRFSRGGGFFQGVVSIAGGVPYLEISEYPSGLHLWADLTGAWAQLPDPCAHNGGIFGNLTQAGPNTVITVCSDFHGQHGNRDPIYRSETDGRNWTRLHSTPRSNYAGPVTALNGRTFFVGIRRSPIYATHDAGIHWRPLALHEQPKFGWLSINFVTRKVGFAITADNHTPLMITHDGGRRWHRVKLTTRTT